MIGFLPNIHSNFELTVFELTVFELTIPDMYYEINYGNKLFISGLSSWVKAGKGSNSCRDRS